MEIIINQGQDYTVSIVSSLRIKNIEWKRDKMRLEVRIIGREKMRGMVEWNEGRGFFSGDKKHETEKMKMVLLTCDVQFDSHYFFFYFFPSPQDVERKTLGHRLINKKKSRKKVKKFNVGKFIRTWKNLSEKFFFYCVTSGIFFFFRLRKLLVTKIKSWSFFLFKLKDLE